MPDPDNPADYRTGDLTSSDPAASGQRDLEAQIAALAAQVKRLGERLGGAPAGVSRLRGARGRVPAPQAEQPRPKTDETLSAGLLASAESVAAEIRASAEREAQRIRDGAKLDTSAQIAGLRAMIAGQRNTLAALSAEIGHLEHSATMMRSLARGLEAELQAIDQALGGAAHRDA
jgi:chromosome segregation ATPase